MRNRIVTVAAEMAAEIGLINITRTALCRRAGITEGSFNYVVEMTFSELIESLRDGVQEPPAEVTRARTNSAGLRAEHILASAICIASSEGYNLITRADVAEAAGVSSPLVNHYFGGMHSLREAIMTAAVAKDIPRIVAQGLAANDPIALAASPALRKRAAKTLADA